jgi:hypothetical protein
MMPRRPHEREAAAARSLDRRACREARRFVGRRADDRVARLDETELVVRGEPLDVLARVTREQLVVGCSASLTCVRKPLEQDGEPLRPFRMSAEDGMQARERRMAQDVDRTISSSSASERSPWARPTR